MFFKRKDPFDPLDQSIMQWDGNNFLTLRAFLQSVLVLGKTGSGKSSGPGDSIMWSLLKCRGSGGFIRCVKPEDGRHFHEMFKAAGRLNDLLIVRHDTPLRCNLLDFVLWQGGDTRDVVHTLTTIGETLKGGETRGGDEGGAFWEESRDRELFRAVNVLKLAGEKVSGPNLQKFIMSAALSREEMADATWQQKYHSQIMQRAFGKKKTPMEDHEWAQDIDYWFSERPAASDRTRSSVLAHVMNILQVFNSGLVRELLSTSTNFSPLDLFAGKWILSDMPQSQEGRFVNGALQYITQRAVLRRDAKPGDNPVVIWVDEYQDAATSFDPVYLAQCRSHLGAMVCLTQSVPGLYAQFKSRTGQNQAQSLLSNFGSQIFCACDPMTAEYASKWLGDEKQTFIGGSMAPQESIWDEINGHARFTGSFSEQYQPVLRSRDFMVGRTGGPANKKLVDAVVIRSDQPFANGKHYLKVAFKQR